jgi:hypothetical protein
MRHLVGNTHVFERLTCAVRLLVGAFNCASMTSDLCSACGELRRVADVKGRTDLFR